MAVVSGIREEVVTAAKKAARKEYGVLATAKVALVSVDNSINGRAGNGGRNRGSGGATTFNQNAAAVGGSSGGSGSGGSGGRGGYNGRGRS